MAGLITGTIGAGLGSLAAGAFGLTADTWKQIGWTAGSLIGNYLFAPNGPDIVTEGPRIGDLKVTSSAYGADIPIIYGSYRTSGNIIFALPLKETKHEERQESGKGGGGGTSTNIWYTYSATFAVAFCEGEISAIGKIWFGSRLVSDGTRYSGGLNKNNHTVYYGTSTQEVDWTIQSKHHDTPAYRNICYIVFRDIQLEDYGNAIPNVTVEIIKDSNLINVSKQAVCYNDVYQSITFFGNDEYCFQSLSSSSETVLVHRMLRDTIVYSNTLTLISGIRRGIVKHSDKPIVICGTDSYKINNITYGKTYIQDTVGTKIYEIIFKNDDTFGTDVVTNDYLFYYNNAHGVLATKSNILYGVNINHLYTIIPETEIYVPNLQILINDSDGNNITYCTYNDIFYSIRLDNTINVYDKQGTLASTINLDFSLSFGTPNYKDDIIFKYNEDYNVFIIIYNTTCYKVSSKGDLINTYSLPLSAKYAILDSDSIYAYNDDIILASGIHKYGPTVASVYDGIAINDSANIGSIVQDIELKSGLNEIDIDNNEGVSISKGYSVSKNMTARSAINPLLSSYDYYILENDFKLKLLKNYGQTPIIISEEDLIDGDNIIISQEQERYKSISVKYINRDNGYETSSQYSMRIGKNATEYKVVELPIVLSDQEAKQISEKNLYLNWYHSITYSFKLTYKYKYLIAGNIISLKNVIIKITKVSINDSYEIECDGIVIDEEAYASDSVGSNTSINYPVISEEIDYTKTIIKDTHTLSNEHINSSGVLCVSSGLTESWKGTNIYRKLSNNEDYSLIYTQINKVKFGNTLAKLGNGITHRIDEINKVKVNTNEILSDISEYELYSGKNYCMIGDEILQFMNATEIDNNLYELSNLLRGRRGTESYTSTHNTYEDFIYLGNEKSIAFFSETIGSTIYYGNSTLGFNSDIKDIGEISYSGKNLKPYSPEYFRSERDINTNMIYLKWMRRSRYISGYFKTLPIAESSEKYSIEVYNNNDALIRTITDIQTDSYMYDYTTDGFNSSSTIKFKVYQISNIVGNGYPSEYITNYGV